MVYSSFGLISSIRTKVSLPKATDNGGHTVIHNFAVYTVYAVNTILGSQGIQKVNVLLIHHTKKNSLYTCQVFCA